MEPTREWLDTEAKRIERMLESTFPKTPPNPAMPIGATRKRTNQGGKVEYYLLDEQESTELFFRTGDINADRPLVQTSLQQPSRPWTDFVGPNLYPWLRDEYSYLALSPQALAYYLPAYLLTAIPYLRDCLFLADRRPEWPSNDIAAYASLNALTPPSNPSAVWDAVSRLSQGDLDVTNKDMPVTGTPEYFVRFAGLLNSMQRNAIKSFVAFALNTYFSQKREWEVDQINKLRQCWVEPLFD